VRFVTLYIDAGFHIEDMKGLVSQDSSTVEKENFKGLVAVCHSFFIYFSLCNTVDAFTQSYILHS
jgi:hypothetical protein